MTYRQLLGAIEQAKALGLRVLDMQNRAWDRGLSPAQQDDAECLARQAEADYDAEIDWDLY